MKKRILPIALLLALQAGAQNSDALYIASGVPVKVSAGSTLYVSGNTTVVRSTTGGIIIDNDGTVQLTGNLQVQGTTGVLDITAGTASSSGTFLFQTANNTQSILLSNGNTLTGNSTLSSVTFNNTATTPDVIISGGNVAVAASSLLTLTAGRVRLGDNNFIHLNPSATAFSAASPGVNTAIITDGTGVFTKYFSANPAANYLLPLGAVSGDYAPFTLKSVTATYGTGAALSFKVKNTQQPCVAAQGCSNKYMNRYWNIAATSLTGISYTAMGQYLTGDITGTEANMKDFASVPAYSGTCNTDNLATTLTAVTTATHQVNFPAKTAFGDFTAGEGAMDFGDLTTTWPIAYAQQGTCNATNNVPNAYNATSNPNVAVWAGAQVSMEPATISGGNTSASTDAYDDGLTGPGTIIGTITSSFTVNLNANNSGTTVYYRLWFDWNNDGNFTNDNDGNSVPATYAGSSIVNTVGTPASVTIAVKPPFGPNANYKARLAVSSSAIADVYRTSGNTTILRITNGEIEDYSAPVILPVKFGSVTADMHNCQALLKFDVKNEVNVKTYFIEQSTDGNNWTIIGALPANGNSSAATYQFMHIAPAKGSNLYRVRQVDADGIYTYSPVAKGTNNCEGRPAIALYPNPAKDKVFISGITSGTTVSLLDAKGRRLSRQKATSTTFMLTVAQLPAGFYQVQLVDENGLITSTQKLIKE